MQLTEEQVRKVARLARIHIEQNDLSRFQQDVSQVLTWVNLLNELDTTPIEPMVSVHLEAMPMRADIVNDGGKVKEILQNAPEAKYNMFVVPKVVE